jgi:hypothetical protein
VKIYLSISTAKVPISVSATRVPESCILTASRAVLGGLGRAHIHQKKVNDRPEQLRREIEKQNHGVDVLEVRA